MTVRRSCVLLVALLGITGSLPAQDEERPRFRLPDRAPSSAEIERLLQTRLDRAMDQDQVRKLMKDMLNGKFDADTLKRLQQQIQEDPDLKKRVENRLLQQPELRKQVEDMLKQERPDPNELRDLARQLAPLRNPPPFPGQPPPPDVPPRPDQPRPDNKQPVPPPPMPQPQPLGQKAPQHTPKQNDWFGKQANDWAKSWTKNIQNLDNETLKGIVEQIQKTGLTPGKVELPEWLKDATTNLKSDLKGWLPALSGQGQGMREWFGSFRPPTVGTWNVGSPSLPSAESTGNGLMLVLMLAGGMGLLAFIWIVLRPVSEAALAAKKARRLGPWPVAPESVATRGQLVQCFEYLARKVMGIPAETSHHHEVGRQLAQRSTTTAQEQAADDLAELYEQARYLPLEEALPTDAIPRARQALRLLATVNAA